MKPLTETTAGKQEKGRRRVLGAHLEDEAVEEEADGGEEDDEGREREEIVVRRVGLALPVHLRQEPPRRRAEPHAPSFFPNPVPAESDSAPG